MVTEATEEEEEEMEEEEEEKDNRMDHIPHKWRYTIHNFSGQLHLHDRASAFSELTSAHGRPAWRFASISKPDCLPRRA